MSKSQRVYQHCRESILNGNYRIGEQIPTEGELMRQFDASRMTVAKALRDLEQQGYLLRRRGSGTFVRDWRENSSRLIGLMTAISGGVFAQFTDEMSRVLCAHGYGLLVSRSGVDQAPDDLLKACDQCLKAKVSAVIFSPLQIGRNDMHLNEQIVSRFREAGIPVVLLDCDIYDWPRRSEFDLVSADQVDIGYMQASHLIQLGYRRIGYLGVDAMIPSITARHAGYVRAMAEHGIPHEPAFSLVGDPGELEFVREALKAARLEALICCNDWELARLMRSLNVL